MRIDVFFCGNLDYSFDSSDKEQINKMVKELNRKHRGDTVEYYTEDGKPILRWPLEDEEYKEDNYPIMGRDYGPSNPWNAPGMSVSDFI